MKLKQAHPGLVSEPLVTGSYEAQLGPEGATWAPVDPPSTIKRGGLGKLIPDYRTCCGRGRFCFIYCFISS